MWGEIGDRVLSGRSLFDVGKAIRFVSDEGRSQFGVEGIGDRVLGDEWRSLYFHEI